MIFLTKKLPKIIRHKLTGNMYKIYQKDLQICFDFMNVILLYRDQTHVSPTHVVIFRVVGARIQIYL